MVTRMNLFHRKAVELSGHLADQAEHEAAVEYLILVEFADRVISLNEQATIEAFVDGHAWDSPTFSYKTYHSVAVAKVRAALGDTARENALLSDISDRLVHPELRSELSNTVDELTKGQDQNDLLLRARKVLKN
jgi:hypothetical protein